MIELHNAGFAYAGGDQAEDVQVSAVAISFTVQAGECVVLCGRSGSGKSTVLRMINGLAPQFYPGELTGSVQVAGTTPASLTPRERAGIIGSVFQDPRSQFFMSVVRDELAFTGENLGMKPEEVIDRVEEAAKLAGISELLDRPLDKLSSGQKQKVAIAAACTLRPKVLILDEPSANLDESSTVELVRLLNKLKQGGTAIVISEHRLHAFAEVADRYVRIEQGQQTDTWTSEQFLALDAETVRAYGLRHPHLAAYAATEIGEANESEARLESKSIGEWSGRGLTYVYRKTGEGVRNTDFLPSPGKVTAILGENGAGKTTLCKTFCGLKRQQLGHIHYGKSRLSAAKRREHSYLVMQDADYQLYADSVAAEVLLGRRIDEEAKKRAREALRAFGLSELSERHPASLSGGQKQRVTLASAYCADVPLILLDEPTSGLDGDGVIGVARWVRKLAREGRTVLIITHNRLLVELACDETIELSRTASPKRRLLERERPFANGQEGGFEANGYPQNKIEARTV